MLRFLAGVIPLERCAMFERMVWRVSRGNAFLRRAEIAMELKDPVTREPQRKVVYMLFFQGDALKQKMKKVGAGNEGRVRFFTMIHEISHGISKRLICLIVTFMCFVSFDILMKLSDSFVRSW